MMYDGTRMWGMAIGWLLVLAIGVLVIAALIKYLFFRRVEAFPTDLRAFLYGCAMPASIFHDRPDWPTAAFAPHDQLAESVDHGVDLFDALLDLDHLRQS